LNWRGKLNKYLASAYKNWIISRRNIFTIFEIFFWPMISLLSIGLLTKFLKVDEGMVSFLLVGAIALTILQVAQIDVAYVLLFDMWSKSIKNTFIAPVKSYHLVFGALLFGIIRGCVVFAILVIVGHWLFGFDFLKEDLCRCSYSWQGYSPWPQSLASRSAYPSSPSARRRMWQPGA